MSKAIPSIENATETTTGSSAYVVAGAGLSMLAVANNLDPANDTLNIALDVKINGNWALFEVPPEQQGNQAVPLQITQDSFSQINAQEPTAHIGTNESAGTEFRARITEFVDDTGGDLSVDVNLLATNRNTKVKR